MVNLSLIALIVLVLLLPGCIDSSTTEWGNAPDFTLLTIDGETFTLSDNFGKVIIIDLMAGWCYWCKPQMAELEKIQEEKGNEIVIISIDVEKSETSEDVINAFGDYVDKWTFLMDVHEEDVSSKYNVYGIPKLVIVDINGDISYVNEGLTNKETLLQEINKANQ